MGAIFGLPGTITDRVLFQDYSISTHRRTTNSQALQSAIFFSECGTEFIFSKKTSFNSCSPLPIVGEDDELLRPGGAHLFGGVEPSHLQAGDNLRKLHTALAP